MKNKTIIFGSRSNLSKFLHKNIHDSVLISSNDFLNDSNFLKSFQDINLKIIINSFYPSSKLNNFTEPLKYIKESLFLLSNILEQIKIHNLKVDKIIYTSSASVYGNNNYCNESDQVIPLHTHSSIKISSEKLLEGFCNEYNIDYTIARVFNMYGGDDSFSIISKIIDSIKNKKVISLVNSGTAIRDFIYIEDVVKSYEKLLKLKNQKIVNIASGNGISIKMILDNLKLKGYDIQINNTKKEEIKISTANISTLSDIIDTSKFIHVNDYIESKLVD